MKITKVKYIHQGFGTVKPVSVNSLVCFFPVLDSNLISPGTLYFPEQLIHPGFNSIPFHHRYTL